MEKQTENSKMKDTQMHAAARIYLSGVAEPGYSYKRSSQMLMRLARTNGMMDLFESTKKRLTD